MLITYDAKGNLISVDNGSTASYVYDALNRKVRTNQVIYNQTVENVFDAWGRVTSGWTSPTTPVESHIFWDNDKLAYRVSANGKTYFSHLNWLGTDRVHTDPAGASGAAITSFAYGDGTAVNYSDPYASWDYRFAEMDYNLESGTQYAQFRQYSDTQGRWMSPDPWDGSYDPSNPQTFNRYSYVLNNPLSFIDPLGLFKSCKEGEMKGCPGPGNQQCGDPPPTPNPPTGPGPGKGDGGGGRKAPNKGNITVKCRGIQTDNLGMLGAQHCDAQVTDCSGTVHSVSGGPQPNYYGETALNAWNTSSPTAPFTGMTVYQGNSCFCCGMPCQFDTAMESGPCKTHL